MHSLSDAALQALGQLASGDPALWTIIGISFAVSAQAITIAVPPALLLAFALACLHFPGRRILLQLFSTLTAVPAVVIGLTLYLLFSRSGPLGDLRLLFTSTAMVVGQVLLCFPLLVVMGHSTLQGIDRRAWETARTLGARRSQAFLTVLHEARFGLLAALFAGFGRIIAEVGASMMIGGNILNVTRNIPTAIALETSKGEFSQGIALGLVLLVVALTLNLSLGLFQGRGEMAG